MSFGHVYLTKGGDFCCMENIHQIPQNLISVLMYVFLWGERVAKIIILNKNP